MRGGIRAKEERVAKTVVGTFRSSREAEQTATALARHGVDPSAIHVLGNAGIRDSAARWTGNSGSFWSWLFGDVESDQGADLLAEDSIYFSRQLARRAAFLTVTCTNEQAERIRELMQRGTAAQVPATASISGADKPPPDHDAQGYAVLRDVGVSDSGAERDLIRVYTHTTERSVEEHIRLRAQRIEGTAEKLGKRTASETTVGHGA